MLTNQFKCPNCGSSAQPRLVSTDHTSDGKIREHYVCGCGCNFTTVYKVCEIYENICKRG